MNKKNSPALVEFAVIAYCTWVSIDVVPSWINTPFQRFGWLAFCIWIFPVLYYWSFPGKKEKQTTPFFLWLGLALTLTGVLGSLNALKHVGLTVAIMGLLPWSWMLLIWLMTALTWMPALSYFARYLPLYTVIIGRILVSLFGMAVGLIAINKK